MVCVRCTSENGRFTCEPCNHGPFCEKCTGDLQGKLACCSCCPSDADPLIRFKLIVDDSISKGENVSHAKAKACHDVSDDNKTMQDVTRRKDLATALYKSGKFSEAITTLSSCITDATMIPKPVMSILYANRSLALMAVRSFSEALADAEKALLLDGTNIKAQFRMAQASLELGDSQRAEYFAEKVYKSTGDLAAEKVISQAKAMICRDQSKIVAVKADENTNINSPIHVEVKKPTVAQISTASALESFLRRSPMPEALIEKLPPECLAWHISNSSHVFGDPDIFVSFIKALHKVSDPASICEYIKYLKTSRNLETVVSMLSTSERTLYDKLIAQSK